MTGEQYTEDIHGHAVDLLQSRDEIQCVIHDYERRMIFIHTPYVASEVVTDFCNFFGYRLSRFGPAWEQERDDPCMEKHGSTFEILLEYTPNSPPPANIETVFPTDHLEQLDESDKQF
jgi:hypothetical protein